MVAAAMESVPEGVSVPLKVDVRVVRLWADRCGAIRVIDSIDFALDSIQN